MKLSMRLLLIALVALPFIVTITSSGRSGFAAANDATDDEEEIEIESEAPTGEEVAEEEAPAEEEEDASEKKTQGSPHIDLSILFVKPVVGDGKAEIPAGRPAEFVIGIQNTGDHDYIIDACDASLRYPQDYNYHIQNFSVAQYNAVVKSRDEASLHYMLVPADVFAGRSLGLVVNVAYHDADGQDFIEAVYNATVEISEVDEGFDGETFFMYLFLMALLGIVGFFGYQAFETYLAGGSAKKAAAAGGKKATERGAAPASGLEMGTTKDGVDLEWLPDHLRHDLKKRVLPTRTSPRLRNP